MSVEEDHKPAVGYFPVLASPEIQMTIKEEPNDDPEEEEEATISREKMCEVKEEDLSKPEISVSTTINIYDNPPKKEEDDEMLPAKDMTLSDCESCTICSKIVPSSVILAHREQHAAELVHPCSRCPKKFANDVVRDEHELLHQRDIPGWQSCRMCSSVFNREDRLQSHLIFFHEDFEDVLQCPHCHYRFRILAQYNYHMKSQHLNPLHKCYHCDFSTNKKAEMVRHRRTTIACKPYVCSICEDLRYEQLHSLAIHWGKRHQYTPWRIKCICPLGCETNHKTIQNFYQHARKVHGFRRPVIEHSCIACEFKCLNPRHLKVHYRKTQHNNVIRCPVCTLKFVERLQFTTHFRACVDTQRAEVKSCGSVFKFAEGSILIKKEEMDEDIYIDNDDGIGESLQDVKTVGWMGKNDEGEDEIDITPSTNMSDLVEIKTEPQD